MLKPGDTLTVRQLLFALMLPSGNDAAVALAEFFGRRMLAADGAAATAVELSAAAATVASSGNNAKDGKVVAAAAAVRRFVREMNNVAASVGLKNTTIHDPHGMRSSSGRNNTSTVRDIVRLMTVAQRIPIFTKVCRTQMTENFQPSITPACI